MLNPLLKLGRNFNNSLCYIEIQMVHELEEKAKETLSHKANRHAASKLIEERYLKPDSGIESQVKEFDTKRSGQAAKQYNEQTGGIVSLYVSHYMMNTN